ncbi:MAG: HAD hydrolase family protein [Bacillus subtilis]|nr:HAD hydrolase family protein [Bacillus subtilis]
MYYTFVNRKERDVVAAEAAPVFPEMNVIVSGPPFVEFLNKDASKGHALGRDMRADGNRHVGSRGRGGRPERRRDANGMAGMSYAVANADEDIKRIARKVCVRSNNDGVLPEVLQDAFGIDDITYKPYRFELQVI